MDEDQIKKMQDELARLTRLVNYDSLTEVMSRRGFMEEIEKVSHLRIAFTVIFADVDHFKNINDTYGHAIGDNALKIIANTLHRHIRLGDLLGRMGGEEFALVLISSPIDKGIEVAEKLRKAVEDAEFMVDGKRVQLTASFGVAEFAPKGSPLEVIEKADKAMYQAKQAGRNRVVAAS